MADIYMPEDVGKMFEYQVKTYFIFDAAGLSLTDSLPKIVT